MFIYVILQYAVNFIPWGPASIQVALSRKSPYVESANKVKSCFDEFNMDGQIIVTIIFILLLP